MNKKNDNLYNVKALCLECSKLKWGHVIGKKSRNWLRFSLDIHCIFLELRPSVLIDYCSINPDYLSSTSLNTFNIADDIYITNPNYLNLIYRAKTLDILNNFYSEEVSMSISDLSTLEDPCYAAGLLLGFPIVYKTDGKISASARALEDVSLKIIQIYVDIKTKKKCADRVEIMSHKLYSFSFPNIEENSVYVNSWWNSERLRILENPCICDADMKEKIVNFSTVVL